MAGRYYGRVAGFLYPHYIGSHNLARFLGFLTILGACLVVASLVATIAHKGADILLLGWADHLAGLAFGLAKGALIVGSILLFLERFPLKELQMVVGDSSLAGIFLHLAPAIGKLLPPELRVPLNF